MAIEKLDLSPDTKLKIREWAEKTNQTIEEVNGFDQKLTEASEQILQEAESDALAITIALS